MLLKVIRMLKGETVLKSAAVVVVASYAVFIIALALIALVALVGAI